MWAMFAFSYTTRNDMIMNNILEAFNGIILEVRDKPIITILK